MKLTLKDGKLQVELSKQERTYLEKAQNIARVVAQLQPLDEKVQAHADSAATGLERLRAVTVPKITAKE